MEDTGFTLQDIIHVEGTFFVIIDRNATFEKGDKFISLYEDESYLDIQTCDIDDFSEWADEDYTDECHKIIGSFGEVDGIPVLEDPREKDIKEAVVLLQDFFQLIRPHINGHITAMTKFQVALELLTKK